MNTERYLLLCVILALVMVPAVNAAMISHWTFDVNGYDSGTMPQHGTLIGDAHIVSETGRSR